MKSELEFLYGEIKHIEWARKNGMSDVVYDDFLGVFRRRIKEIEGKYCGKPYHIKLKPNLVINRVCGVDGNKCNDCMELKEKKS